MFEISFPADELRKQARRAQDDFDQKRKPLLDQLGVKLVSIADESFEKRSQGQSDVGITWDPLTAAHLKRKIREGDPADIGIRTGEMKESLDYQVAGKTVAVEYDVLHAVFFDKLRPLFPQEFPKDWQQSLEEEVTEWADDILISHFEDAA